MTPPRTSLGRRHLGSLQVPEQGTADDLTEIAGNRY
ncbi:hypothetical protein SAMN05216506_106248 [Saccharopolyspora kobensis]|uniref:Uncharacterized protein n=1 Tax=Saccharopolyspora kobensis TaxID=146035 RepID=A0ABY1DZ60_9PSEU|nr:hypothetical protein SAMN05216506_106248 [Saccharopolyspora kobensis]